MRTVRTYTAQIQLGLRVGYSNKVINKEDVHTCCQRFVDDEKLCVSVSETTFIYTQGIEKGLVITLISYPRFPSEQEELESIAITLGTQLKEFCKQLRVSIVLTDYTLLLE